MTKTQRGQGCVAYDPSVDTGPYDYRPSEVAGIIFTIVFATSMFAHSFQYIYKRKWFYVVFSLAATGRSTHPASIPQPVSTFPLPLL